MDSQHQVSISHFKSRFFVQKCMQRFSVPHVFILNFLAKGNCQKCCLQNDGKIDPT